MGGKQTKESKDTYEPLLQDPTNSGEVPNDAAVSNPLGKSEDLEKGNTSRPSLASAGRYSEQQKQSTVSERYHVSPKRLLALVRPEWKILIVATICLFLSTVAQLAQPMFFGRIVTVASSDDSTHDQMSDLKRYSVILLIIMAFGAVTAAIRGWLYTLLGERLVRNLRKMLFEKMIIQDISFFDLNKTGELINRLSSDTTVIQSCLSVNISMGLRAVSQTIISFCLLFITSWQLTVVMLAVVPVLVISAVIYGRFTKRLSKEYQDALAKAADSGAESIANSRIMKSFGAEDWEIIQYAQSVNLSYRKGSKKAGAYGIFVGYLGFFAGFAMLVVVYYGAVLVIHDEMKIGDLTAFVMYTLYIAINMGIMSSLYTEFMNALGASER
jgi:ABC-type multidrug transport system fused ATPase/permease subunit